MWAGAGVALNKEEKEGRKQTSLFLLFKLNYDESKPSVSMCASISGKHK